MPEPIAYLSGRFLPMSQLQVSPYDTGFMQGATVAEQLRTFGQDLFRWDDHARRLRRSLEIVGLARDVDLQHVAGVAGEVLQHNRQLINAHDDLGLTIFVTPGIYATYGPDTPPVPTLAVHTYPLPFGLWVDKYEQGQAAIIADVVQVSARSWPRDLKCRSRMHYYLADQAARKADPAARAILLDEDGLVNEATTANVMAFFPEEGIVSPPLETILPGVSLQTADQLATQAGIAVTYRPLDPRELQYAAEIMLTSTSPCLLPVVCLDRRPIGDGRPGPVFKSLLAAWSNHVGVNIAAQARRFRDR